MLDQYIIPTYEIYNASQMRLNNYRVNIQISITDFILFLKIECKIIFRNFVVKKNLETED
jgi:hypothetical protein